jgi:Zn-dependent peptidase ImmA (M78 family)
MNLSLVKIKTVFPYFNERPITVEEFWKAAKKAGVIVRQMPLRVDGYYTTRRGRHFILINSKLTGLDWLMVALHEFYHFLFDVPGEETGYAFYRNGQYVDRREYKADAFAVIGLLPWPEIMKMSAEDVSPSVAELVRSRIVVRTHFGV